jgi:hypothetical protein
MKTKYFIAALIMCSGIAAAFPTTPDTTKKKIRDLVETTIKGDTVWIEVNCKISGAWYSKKLKLPLTGIFLGDSSVSYAKLKKTVAGAGLGGGLDSALIVLVDGSTIEINSDVLRVKDAGIDSNKIAPLAVQTSDIAASAVGTAQAKMDQFSNALKDSILGFTHKIQGALLDTGIVGINHLTQAARNEIRSGGNIVNNPGETLVQNADSTIDINWLSFLNQGIWSKQGIVISPTLAGEGTGTVEPNVIWDGNVQILAADSVFKMWYRGDNGATQNIYYAESIDGIVWTKMTMPVLTGYTQPFVFKYGFTYYFYGSNGNLAEYTSSNGITWSLVTANALNVGEGGAWDHQVIANSFVWVESGTWHMLYEACANTSYIYSIGLATSANGTTWTKSLSNPVLTGSGEFGGPFLYKSGATYWVWVHTASSGNLPTDIRRYYSSNLTSWTKSPSHPTLSRTTTDEGVGNSRGQIGDVSMVQVNDKTYIYYDITNDQTNFKISLAKADLSKSQIVTTSEGTKQTVASEVIPAFNAAYFDSLLLNGLVLSSYGSYNLHLGGADAAVCQAQHISVQKVLTGTSNKAGESFYIDGSVGTGTGAGGKIVFRTSPVGASGSTQNALRDAGWIDDAGFLSGLKQLNIMSNSAAGMMIYDTANVKMGGYFINRGGNSYLDYTGALQIRGSAGTVPMINVLSDTMEIDVGSSGRNTKIFKVYGKYYSGGNNGGIVCNDTSGALMGQLIFARGGNSYLDYTGSFSVRYGSGSGGTTFKAFSNGNLMVGGTIERMTAKLYTTGVMGCSSTFWVGDSSTYSYIVPNGDLVKSSDLTKKTGISNFEIDGLWEKFKAVNPINYSWKNDKNKIKYVGFGAQEFNPVFDPYRKSLDIDNSKVMMVVWKTIQEAQKRIEKLEEKVNP